MLVPNGMGSHWTWTLIRVVCKWLNVFPFSFGESKDNTYISNVPMPSACIASNCVHCLVGRMCLQFWGLSEAFCITKLKIQIQNPFCSFVSSGQRWKGDLWNFPSSRGWKRPVICCGGGSWLWSEYTEGKGYIIYNVRSVHSVFCDESELKITKIKIKLFFGRHPHNYLIQLTILVGTFNNLIGNL